MTFLPEKEEKELRIENIRMRLKPKYILRIIITCGDKTL